MIRGPGLSSPVRCTHKLCDYPHNMWVYRTGKGYGDTPIILYEYQKTRKADHPREFLKGFTGVVVCDGYSAYRKLDRETEAIVFAGCWTHARRYFADALKVLYISEELTIPHGQSDHLSRRFRSLISERNSL